MDWPFLYEGHTLEREFEGLRCTECGKGASDIVGRPRWSISVSSAVFPNVVVAGLVVFLTLSRP
eukprot:544358-Amphidinium_carterae.1